MVRRPFDILGIEATKDTRQIKKAYAALVRQYHPEEHPQDWARIHEAYQAAMAYAEGRQQEYVIRQAEVRQQEEWEQKLGAEESEEESEDGSGRRTEEGGILSREREVVEDAEYGAVFQEVQTHWMREKTEREEKLWNRLQELAGLRGRMAVKEWQRFFSEDFLPDEGADAWMLLLEAIDAPLPEKVLRLILTVMKTRLEYYHAKDQAECSHFASAVIRRCQEQLLAYRPARRKPLSKLWVLPALAACIIVLGIVGLYKEKGKAGDVLEKTVAYLNAKYGEGRYAAGDLVIEEVTLFGDNEERIESYEIREEEFGPPFAYAVRDKESADGGFEIFDNIQAKEIKQALEDRVNELTGCAEGRLFWNSGTDDSTSGGIEDGLFQTRYEGDFDAFIAKESKVRKWTPKGLNLSLSTGAPPLNGICDYYLPDPEIRTLREKFETQDFTADTGLQEVLNSCAAKYSIQLRGVMLSREFFEGKMRRAAWDDTGMMVLQDIGGISGLEPSVSFLMLTRWYVNLPPETEKRLNIRSGMYIKETVQMGRGIYGAESSIRSDQFGLDQEWTQGSIQEIETPGDLGLTEAQREKAVSFQLASDHMLSNDCCLAIDKEIYGIADSGYQVIISEQEDGGMDSREAYVREYTETGAVLKNGDVLDGEGFVFLEYKAEMAPQIVTIVNP